MKLTRKTHTPSNNTHHVFVDDGAITQFEQVLPIIALPARPNERTVSTQAHLFFSCQSIRFVILNRRKSIQCFFAEWKNKHSVLHMSGSHS